MAVVHSTPDHPAGRGTSRSRRRTLAALLSLPLVASTLLLASAPAAQADDRVCRGVIRAVSVDDNIVVPRGATCRLLGTRVEGNVEVRRNARLFARGVRVDGNIQAQRARRVAVRPRNGKRSVVEGNIQLERGGNGGVVARVVVDGDIQLFSNRGRFRVRGNVVDGNLQCKSNRPKPRGRNNRVEGNKEGQCRGL